MSLEDKHVMLYGECLWASQSPWSLVSRLSASDLAYSAHHKGIIVSGVRASVAT